jgi:hypothetical protein
MVKKKIKEIQDSETKEVVKDRHYSNMYFTINTNKTSTPKLMKKFKEVLELVFASPENYFDYIDKDISKRNIDFIDNIEGTHSAESWGDSLRSSRVR